MVDHQVARLDIAVNDAPAVQILQRPQGMSDGTAERAEIHLASGETVAEVPLHQFHDEPAPFADDVEHRHDVGVLQGREELCFGPVAVELLRLFQELRVNLLDGDFAAEFEIPRPIHRGKAAGPDLLQQFVARLNVHRYLPFDRFSARGRCPKRHVGAAQSAASIGYPTTKRDLKRRLHDEHPIMSVGGGERKRRSFPACREPLRNVECADPHASASGTAGTVRWNATKTEADTISGVRHAACFPVLRRAYLPDDALIPPDSNGLS